MSIKGSVPGPNRVAATEAGYLKSTVNTGETCMLRSYLIAGNSTASTSSTTALQYHHVHQYAQKAQAQKAAVSPKSAAPSPRSTNSQDV
eukprot:3886771-Rhodomonas_salina.1